MSQLGYTPGAGAQIKTDQGGTSGSHMQIVKLAEGGAGSENLLPSDVANGLDVDVTRVQGSVTVAQGNPANLRVDASGVPVPVTDNGASLTVDAPATAPVAVRLSNGTTSVDTIPVQVTNPSSQGAPNTTANAWPVKLTDGTNSPKLTQVGATYALDVNVAQRANDPVKADKSAFTEGTSTAAVVAGVVNETPSSDPTEDQAAALRITPKRGVHVNLRNNGGVEIGTSGNPVRTDPTGTTTQPVSGTITANAGTGNFNENLAQVGGQAVVSAAAGVQKVGIAASDGANFSKTNPLPVIESELGFTRVSKAASFTQTATDLAIWTPASGKRFVVLSMDLEIASTNGGFFKIYDHTNAGDNMIYQGAPTAGHRPLRFPKPWVSAAANNVLRVSAGGTALSVDVTVFGYEI